MANEPARPPDPERPPVYRIRIEGHLPARLSDRFDGLAITWEGGGTTLLVGPVSDQAALHAVLRRVRDLGLPLLSVVRVEDEPPPERSRTDGEGGGTPSE